MYVNDIINKIMCLIQQRFVYFAVEFEVLFHSTCSTLEE